MNVLISYKNFKTNVQTAICISIFLVLTSCKADDDCTCNGLFRYPNGTEVLVLNVDCVTGEPGAPAIGTIPPTEPEYLGCND